MTLSIKKIFGMLYASWVTADFTLLLFSFLYNWLIGDLSEMLSEAIMNWLIGLIPFPFDFIVVWAIDPVYIILQVIMSLFIFLIWIGVEVIKEGD